MPESIQRNRCGVRRRAPCRAAVLQAQARPPGYRNRWRGAATEITTNELRKISSSAGRAANARRTVAKAVAPKRKPAKPSRRRRKRRCGQERGRAATRIRSREPAADRIRSRALSDITAFLRAGVPAELTRAALRRVWTADPAIRDFVGLAENAWDFTDPNAMPGFGPLESTEEVRRMIAQVVDQIGEAARPQAAEERARRGRARKFECIPMR